MNYYTDLKTLKNYRDSPAISQSFLKRVLSNNTREFKETIPMLLGSYVDCLLSSAHLKEDLFIDDLDKRPSETIRGFLIQLRDILLSTGSSIGELKDHKDLVIQIARDANYNSKWGDEAIWNAIEKDGSTYWEFLLKSDGKSILTKEEKELSNRVVSLTLDHHVTGKYFIEQPNVDKYFQKDIYWKYNGLNCKGLIDLLIVEHETKSIYLIDIKSTTVSSIEEWFRVCKSKNYPFQLAFYKEGVEQFLANGYTVYCRWMVLPLKGEIFKPWIIPCTDLMLTIGKSGYSEHKKIVTKGEKHTAIQYSFGFDRAVSFYWDSVTKGLKDFDILYDVEKGRMSEFTADQYFITK